MLAAYISVLYNYYLTTAKGLKTYSFLYFFIFVIYITENKFFLAQRDVHLRYPSLAYLFNEMIFQVHKQLNVIALHILALEKLLVSI